MLDNLSRIDDNDGPVHYPIYPISYRFIATHLGSGATVFTTVIKPWNSTPTLQEELLLVVSRM
jgi:hypothetical protein